MRFNTAFVVVGLAAAASAIPLSTEHDFNARSDLVKERSPDSFDFAARDLGMESDLFERGLDETLERREYDVQITFVGSGVSPTPESKETAKEMVKTTMKAAGPKLKMGTELNIDFTNTWSNKYTGEVTFTFEDPICKGTCTGLSLPGGKGKIMSADAKKKPAKVLWEKK
ncbi:hypothetical protein GYMLUDRAFT_97031 [Collybiopsis luxurians FD-317 M1]|uniref:Uncharacterized protein n=1 Tax=Collybiopsis luxurians FD-317 M1 TaxID=944289 RepID=A0A0D0CPC4_9AGAR|nr:hypothetical protein GYMLUDRAFT_97031 [Collybiopsis luxurians FD-317 M1]